MIQDEKQKYIQEGEDPAELLSELEHITEELMELIKRINHTNCVTMIGEEAISDLLASRDVMLQKRKILRTVMESAGMVVSRHSCSEIKIHSTMDIKKLQKQVDDLSKAIRQTDTKIQETNWLIELI